MKQYITENQLRKLNQEQKESLIKWFAKLKGTFFINENEVWVDSQFLPLLSIGQMIEFLDKNAIERFDGIYLEFEPDKGFYAGHFGIGWSDHNELCDALWESVKETL